MEFFDHFDFHSILSTESIIRPVFAEIALSCALLLSIRGKRNNKCYLDLALFCKEGSIYILKNSVSTQMRYTKFVNSAMAISNPPGKTKIKLIMN